MTETERETIGGVLDRLDAAIGRLVAIPNPGEGLGPGPAERVLCEGLERLERALAEVLVHDIQTNTLQVELSKLEEARFEVQRLKGLLGGR